MTEEKDTIVFNLSDFWAVFTRHMILILLVGVLTATAVFGYGMYMQEKNPVYKSTATLYVLKRETGDYSYTTTDFKMALDVVNDCEYILRSHAVLDTVIEELNLKDQITYTQLKSSISANNPEGTRVLEVSVRAAKRDQAKTIVDSLCRIGSTQIAKTMGLDQINVFDWGTFPSQPSNTVSLKRVILAGLCAALVVYFIFLALFLSDDKVRTEEDVQHYLDLTVLGVIPNVQEVESKKFKKKKRYDSYKIYGSYGAYGAQNGPQNGVNSERKAESNQNQDGGDWLE